MMKKAFLLGFLLCLAALPVASASGLEEALALPSPSTGTCRAPAAGETAPLFATAGCWAECANGTTLYCNDPSGTCTFQDQECNGCQQTTPGYLTCNGTTQNCPACPAECTNGFYKYVNDGCCSNGKKRQRKYVCSAGCWLWTDQTTCTTLACTLDP